MAVSHSAHTHQHRVNVQAAVHGREVNEVLRTEVRVRRTGRVQQLNHVLGHLNAVVPVGLGGKVIGVKVQPHPLGSHW